MTKLSVPPNRAANRIGELTAAAMEVKRQPLPLGETFHMRAFVGEAKPEQPLDSYQSPFEFFYL